MYRVVLIDDENIIVEGLRVIGAMYHLENGLVDFI